MSTLDDLITRSNNVLAVLENLIEGEAAETIIPDDRPTGLQGPDIIYPLHLSSDTRRPRSVKGISVRLVCCLIPGQFAD